jgi:hypothetical protein
MSDIDDIHGDKFSDTSISETRVGQSVESQAQIRDASITTTPGETLNIYRLEPTARSDDPRWQNAPMQGAVTVAARTAGDARIVATSHEVDFQQVDAAPAEGVSTDFASAFRDEKLYTVIEIARGRTDLSRGVIDAGGVIETIKPLQD